MIEINLLPVREARRRAEMQQQGILLGLVLGVAIAVCALAQATMMARLSGARDRVAQLDSQIAQFQSQLEQVEQFKKKAAEIEQKLGVIRKLELSRSGPVRLLDELASRTPEKLWITSLEAKGSLIEMKGMSLDTELIASFLNQLNDSPYVKDVELKSTELADAGTYKLNSFLITAVLTSPEAETEPAAPASAPATTPAAAPAQG